jgi:hypothetical protein
MEISRATNGRQADSEENSNIQPKKEANHRTSTVEDGKISILFKSTEETMYGLIHDDNDDDKIVLEIFLYAVKFKLYDILETGPATPV